MISIEYLKNAESIFWDFDGVIKDSVEVKSDAFEQLFLPFGKVTSKKIREHHEENGGMSRFDKIPIYLKWSNQEASQQMIDKYLQQFSKLVKDKVIDSEWAPGVLDYLQNNHNKQTFFLITATPQKEIESILYHLKIESYFKLVVGSPINKIQALSKILDKYNINLESSVMVGDSISDYEASIVNKITFILCKTKFNIFLQKQLNCIMVKDFYE